MYGAFGFVKVQNPRGTGELRQIKKDDGKTGNSEVSSTTRTKLDKSLSYETLCLSHSLDTAGLGVAS